MRKTGLYLFLICSFFSCDNIASQNDTIFLKKIEINPQEATPKFLEDLAEETVFTPLTPPFGLKIKKIDRVFFADSLIFILDKSLDAVLIFGKDGKMLNKIPAKGKGQGKFTQITDVFFDKIEKKVEVYDGAISKIVIYDFQGKFIEEKNINSPEKSGAMFYKFNNNYFFERITVIKADKGRLSVFSNNNPSYKKSFLEIPNSISNVAYGVNFNAAIFRDSLFYIPLLDNKIYSVSANDAKPVYELILPEKYLVPEKLVNGPAMEDYNEFLGIMSNQGAVYGFSHLFMNENYIAGSYKEGYQPWSLKFIYSKRTGKTLNYTKLKSHVVPSLNVSGSVIGNNGDYFIINIHHLQYENLPVNTSKFKLKGNSIILMQIKFKEF
ncbi:6-bladed beta-propeller [Adhaeribacter aquaticus]|uniref:6-bladed beta-propeller n=1 Tax=Adhaeribacter aquaticus TaxID=299567 RepID=UPI000425267E|nr:6-bladed beta-propeller [Adhaeribacter aquaticus]